MPFFLSHKSILISIFAHLTNIHITFLTNILPVTKSALWNSRKSILENGEAATKRDVSIMLKTSYCIFVLVSIHLKTFKSFHFKLNFISVTSPSEIWMIHVRFWLDYDSREIHLHMMKSIDRTRPGFRCKWKSGTETNRNAFNI